MPLKFQFLLSRNGDSPDRGAVSFWVININVRQVQAEFSPFCRFSKKGQVFPCLFPDSLLKNYLLIQRNIRLSLVPYLWYQ